MCMSRVLSLLRKSLSHNGLESFIDIGLQRVKVHDVSFVDDVALPVLCDPAGLCDKIGKTTDCAIEVFSSFGMKLNFSPGKSEATVGFFGPGRRCAKKQLFLANDCIPIAGGCSLLREWREETSK